MSGVPHIDDHDLGQLRGATVVAGHLDVRRLHDCLAGLHGDRRAILELKREGSLEHVDSHWKAMGVPHRAVAWLERGG